MNISGPSLARLAAPGRTSLILGGVLLLAFAVYANTLGNGFVYDDHQQVEENPYARSFQYVGKIFSSTVWSFQGEEGKTNYYRPLMTLSYLLSNKAFQGLPYGFHLINILLNCVVVGLVFVAGAALFADEVVALAAAALFALHPIHTEVVAWIAAVTELELAIFYLASFVFFLRLGAVEPTQERKSRLFALIFFALALLSKEQAMTLVILATVYEHFYRPDCNVTTVRIKISRYGGFWMIGAAYLLFRATVLGGLAPVSKHPDVTWPQLIFSGFAILGEYVAKLFWPHPLLVFYEFHKSTALNDSGVLLGLAVVLSGSMFFVFLWNRARIYSFGVIWIFLALVPVLNARWMATNVFAERYLYLPSVGFCWLLSGAVVWLFRKVETRTRMLPWLIAVTSTALAAVAATQVVARNRDWHDDFVLTSRALIINPHAPYMKTNLGVLEWQHYHYEEAERLWRLELAEQSDNPVALSNLGLAMLRKQYYEDAKQYLQRSIAVRPRFAAPHIHLGSVYVAEGNATGAETEFRRAVDISPLNSQARNALGKFYFDHGKFAEAQEQYQVSADSLPNVEAWNRLGDIYVRQGRPEEAEHAWRKALELSPFDTDAHLALGNVCLTRGRNAEAEKEYRAVLLMDPKNTAALEGLAKINANAK